MALTMRTVAIKNSTHLLVPKDIARLLNIEKDHMCTVDIRLRVEPLLPLLRFQTIGSELIEGVEPFQTQLVMSGRNF